MDETQDDSRENSYNRNSEKDEKIYEGSSLTLNQFRFIFIFFVHKMKLPLNQRDNLVKFVKYLLPANNILPYTYSSMVKHYFKDLNKPVILKLCNFCEQTLSEGICKKTCCSLPEYLQIIFSTI